MTTHVFIVNDTAFKYHLEYMFTGTGSGEKVIDFNNSSATKLYAGNKQASEKSLVAMMADGCRVRKNDLIIFYLQATSKNKKHEGMFFGIFQAVEDGVFLDNFENGGNNQFLYGELKKSLTFRLKIKPYEVYSNGVTEWSALDEIKNIHSPYQMLWSLIYRKLKGNRGNTMITIYEAERLINLIRNENNNSAMNVSNSNLTYNKDLKCIATTDENFSYTGRSEKVNILPRLIDKYNLRQAHEVHLQMYITQNIGLGTNKSLDDSLGIADKKIEWLGNEIFCGFNMQKIDVMFSKKIDESEHLLVPIELKAVETEEYNINQIRRYVEWIEQYYIPNTASIIQPVLICKKASILDKRIFENFKKFNDEKHGLPLKFIEYEITQNEIIFSETGY